MKDEIKEILEYLKNDNYFTENPEYEVSPYDLFKILNSVQTDKLLDYITNLQEKVEYNVLVIKALHRYFTEHECYETHEFLRQLESCTENDMVWLKRMAGVSNE